MPVNAPDNLLDPPAASATDIKTRAVSGVKVLAARTLVSVLLRVVSSLVLARLLFPHDYGVFGVVAYITGLGMFLCDAGLAGSLVRQHRAPTRDETFTVFWSQQIMTAAVVAVVIGTAPLLLHLYNLSPAALILLISMALGLFLSSLRVIPMMVLERDLQFPTIARCELIENVAQTASTILFAYLGWGAWALAGGGLIRGVVGLICVWLASPWRPHGTFHVSIVKELARFGIAFQLNALLPTIMGGWMPLVVGRLLGVAAVGLVGWATNISSVPWMLSGVLNRVAFPAYSRLQADPDALGAYLISSIRRTSAVFCLLMPLFVIVCPVLIPTLFHARWIPAIPLVQWFSLEWVVLIILGLVAAAQNAIGYSGERLAITVVMGCVRWAAGFFAIKYFQLAGIGPAVLIVSTIDLIVTIFLLKRRSSACASLFSEVFGPLAVMLFTLVLSLEIGHYSSLRNVWISTTTSLLTFLCLTFAREILTAKRPLTKEFRQIYQMLKPTYTAH